MIGLEAFTVMHRTSHASLWILWTVTSSSVNLARWAPLSVLLRQLLLAVTGSAALLPALICDTVLLLIQLSSESLRIDMLTSRLINWTRRRINLLTHATNG